MEVKEALRSLLQEMILPELDSMKVEQVRTTERLNSLDKRVEDINGHLVDQSRRIDAVRDELVSMIGDTNKRIDSARDELVSMIGETNRRIDDTNKRIDRLYEVIVRKEEHFAVERKVEDIIRRVEVLERRLTA